MDKLFLIGIGGTGMRCVEAFVHLCAMGLMDNKEIDILSLDTDTGNGNKSKTETLINNYINIKGGTNGAATENNFFSAKLNLYKYAPNYDKSGKNYKGLTTVTAALEETKNRNNTITDLFFNEDVQSFDLTHGYRAQTHLGSLLMYHSIIQSALKWKNNQGTTTDNELIEYLNKIYQAGDNARVFIMGSVFGGTGASSIPIIPRALRDAMKIKGEGQDLGKNAKFGCSLLTHYFRFNPPKPSSMKGDDAVIASSNNFARNSQAALMFYEEDSTVKNTYKYMYHIGWPLPPEDYDKDSKERDTVTGGGNQKNNPHVAELITACSAIDFFNQKEENMKGHKLVYKSADFSGKSFDFEFMDFLGQERAYEFMNKITSFFALNIIINNESGSIRNLLNNLEKYNNVHDYKDLPPEFIGPIDNYFKEFGFSFNQEKVVPGWLFHIKESVGGEFLFDPRAFSTNSKELSKFSFGDLLKEEKFQYGKKKRFGIAGELVGDLQAAYEEYRKSIQQDKELYPPTSFPLPERFLAHNFNVLKKLYKIINN